MAMFLFGLVSAIALIQTFLSLLFIVGLLYRINKKEDTVCVVVLGDIGRSPRMQYHAASYLKENFKVNILGFYGSTPIKSLCDNDKVSFVHLKRPWEKFVWMPDVVNYVLKALYQSFQLFFTLLFIVEKPGHFLVQNPPSIPTLCIVWLMTCIKGSGLVIDWHNYAYSILNLNIKQEKHMLVRFAKWYEGFFGFLADKNICVTKSMKADLKLKWHIGAEVLYDRPPGHFNETSTKEKHKLFLKLVTEGYKEFQDDDQCTIITEKNGTGLKQDRPAILVSSTSWTEDEDFGFLLNALDIYEKKKKTQPNLPKLICIITGKGPLKSYYQELIQKMDFANITILTPWLSPEDYPKIIGSGDLGICLHTSSSGLDLPMKVVDMFGCRLPVCAVNFSCLHELVEHGVNGLTFQSSNELADQLVELLHGFPDHTEKLQHFRNNLITFQNVRWHENWKNVVLPMISGN